MEIPTSGPRYDVAIPEDAMCYRFGPMKTVFKICAMLRTKAVPPRVRPFHAHCFDAVASTRESSPIERRQSSGTDAARGGRWFSTKVVNLVLVVCLAMTGARSACADDEELRQQVPAAIAQGQQFLFSKQSAISGQWKADEFGQHKVGVHALVLLALMSSGVSSEQNNVARGLEWLREQDTPTQVYDLSLTIMALSAAGNKQRDFRRVSGMAERLAVYQSDKGGWSYGDSRNGSDNSNSQYAMLGLRDAAYFGATIQPETWRLAEQHWLRGKGAEMGSKSGAGFGYSGKGGVSGSMTVAGVASLVITSMFPHRDGKVQALDCCGDFEPTKAEQAISAGERWLGNHFTVRSNPGRGKTWILYYLYGLERAGRLTGRRFFGKHDWYREGARFLASTQGINGSWTGDGHAENDPVIGTCLSLLFLSKGLTPILVNKLQYGVDVDKDPVAADDGSWNAHRYDVRNLVDYLSTQDKWPKLISWQVVDLKKAAFTQDVDALLQAPVQIIEGRTDLSEITRAERALLSEYLQQGGFLFIVRNCGDPKFDAGVRQLVADLVPDPGYTLEKLPPGHDIYRSEELFLHDPPNVVVPELYGVDFGCRTAIVYSPDDHACRWGAWNRRVVATYARPVVNDIVNSVQLGANVLSYATGRELFDKLNAPESVDSDVSIRESPLPIARLRHTGGWDSAPSALRNLTKALSKFGVDAEGPTPTVSATDKNLYKFPLLYTHGRRNFTLTEEEIDGLRNHLENGGMLFADACCGAEAFDASFREIVEAVTGKELERIPADDELFRLPGGYDISRVRRRQPSSDQVGPASASNVPGEPFVEGVKLGDRYAVLYSKYDLSCALERQTTVSCAGYIVEDAIRIATNIVLYAIFQDVSNTDAR